jgi:hypothetical protein
MLLPIAALASAVALSGCANEAGSSIRSADFGSATMNNHLVQTCAAGPVTEGKYAAPTGGCPGRTLDGRYARVVYTGYVADAVPAPAIGDLSE